MQDMPSDVLYIRSSYILTIRWMKSEALIGTLAKWVTFCATRSLFDVEKVADARM